MVKQSQHKPWKIGGCQWPAGPLPSTWSRRAGSGGAFVSTHSVKAVPRLHYPLLGQTCPVLLQIHKALHWKNPSCGRQFFHQTLLCLQKFSAKTVFGKKRGRVRSCTTVCNAFSASSARARVQKCTKMQAGRSFAVAETCQQLIAVVHWQSMEEQLRCFFNPPPLTLSSRQCLGQRNQENLRGLKTWQKAEGIGKSILHAQEISRILFLHYECNVKVLLYR